MLATISTRRRPAVGLKCYADNPALNYVDPTGTTQAGNPLTNLFAGGYSGGTVASNKFVNPYVSSTNTFSQPTKPFSTPKVDPLLQQLNEYTFNQTTKNLYNPDPLSGGTFGLTTSNLSKEVFHQSQLPKGSTTSNFYDSIGTRVAAGQTPGGQVYYFDPATGARDFRELQTIGSESGNTYQVFSKPGTSVTLFDEPGTLGQSIDAALTLTGLKGAKTAGQVGKFVGRELLETARDLAFEYTTGVPYVFNFAQPGRRTAKSVDNAASGLTIRNSHLAGQKHPVTKIPFDKQGFPDFSAVSIKTVKIQQTGKRGVDAVAANRAAGLTSTPEGYTWHHHQNGTTMQLVSRPIHEATGHTGGVAVKKSTGR